MDENLDDYIDENLDYCIDENLDDCIDENSDTDGFYGLDDNDADLMTLMTLSNVYINDNDR